MTEEAGAVREDLAPLLQRLAAVAEALPADPTARLSWSALLSGEAETAAARRRFVIVKPVIDFASLAPMAAAVAAVEAADGEIGLTEANGARLRRNGEHVKTQEEGGYVGTQSKSEGLMAGER